MKFQCGKCGKNYLIDNAHRIDKKITLACTKCNNGFVIRENMSFSSASGDSKIICANCGQLVDEKVKVCPSCGLVLDKQDEALRIDNKVYETIVIDDGKVVQQNAGGKGRSKGPLLIGIILCILLLCGGLWFIDNNRDTLKNTFLKPVVEILPPFSGKTATQVVIMRSGETYHARKIEHNGSALRITTREGVTVTVAEKDVMQIAEAVLEE